MGHAYSSIVADFFARFKKINGFKVYFLTGTDEHGQKIEKASIDAEMDTLEFCNKISKTFKDLSLKLNLSNNDFIRTTGKRHKLSVEKLWKILEKKMKFICQNIRDGIQYLTKHFILMMKLSKK